MGQCSSVDNKYLVRQLPTLIEFKKNHKICIKTLIDINSEDVYFEMLLDAIDQQRILPYTLLVNVIPPVLKTWNHKQRMELVNAAIEQIQNQPVREIFERIRLPSPEIYKWIGEFLKSPGRRPMRNNNLKLIMAQNPFYALETWVSGAIHYRNDRLTSRLLNIEPCLYAARGLDGKTPLDTLRLCKGLFPDFDNHLATFKSMKHETMALSDEIVNRMCNWDAQHKLIKLTNNGRIHFQVSSGYQLTDHF